MGIGYGDNSGDSYSVIGQMDQASIGEVMMIGEVTGLYTPLHTTSDFPESWHVKLSICAARAARRGGMRTMDRKGSWCSQALTSLAPRRRGRAWTPVAPTTSTPLAAEVAKGVVGMAVRFTVSGLANSFATVAGANLGARVTRLAATESTTDTKIEAR